MSRKKPASPAEAPADTTINYKVKLSPRGERQTSAIKNWKSGKDLMLAGWPGTGKTYLALAIALNEVMKPNSTYHKVVIFRSFVPTRDIGFLKGGPKEKGESYEKPYITLCEEIFGDKDAYAKLKAKGIIEFESTSFQRGCSHHNSIIVCDEIQNYEWNETLTIFTRVGENTRLIACGDAKQDDVSSQRYHRESGIRKLSCVIDHMSKRFHRVDFEVEDIQRSEFVKEFIIAVDELGF